MERVLISGAGAMGTIIGALISGDNNDVTLLDTYHAHVAELNAQGAQITGGLETIRPVNAITPAQLDEQYDLIISTVKQTALQASLKQLLPYLHRDSIVLTLQNGIPESFAGEVVGEHRVIGGGMEFSGTFIGPGVVKLASDATTLGVTIGETNGTVTSRLQLTQAILKPIGHCEITTKLREARFTKLTDNCVCSAVPTALGCLLGEALDNPQALNCIAELGRECSQVMQRLNISPVELFGFLPSPDNIDFGDTLGRTRAMNYWFDTYQAYRGQCASMLQDIQQQRECEVDFINGAILKEAKQLGIDMPMNERVISSIKRLQNKPQTLSRAWENLSYLEAAISH